MQDNEESLLRRRIEELSRQLEKMQIAEYVALLQKPTRLIWLNFLAGVAKGLGAAFGATLVFALVVKMLSNILVLNLPIISDWIAQIIQLVEQKNGAL
jgi:hypothetical protein